MTNKTAEQEAVFKISDEGHKLAKMLDEAEQRGYQRALEEVEKIMNERWWPISDSRLIELTDVINNLKAKGGANGI